MFDICAYAKYKVRAEREVTDIDEENSLPGDLSYKTYKSDFISVISGGELLDYIGKHLVAENVCGVRIIKDVVTIDYFNPMNGTGSTRRIYIEDYEEDNNE